MTQNKIDTPVASKEVVERLQRLRALYETALNAENVKLLDHNLIRQAGEILSKFRFEDESVVNNYDMRHINGYIDFAASNRVEYTVIPVYIPLYDPKDDDESVSLSKKGRLSRRVHIDVPEGYDGHDSFIFLKFFAEYSDASNGRNIPDWADSIVVTHVEDLAMPVEATDIVSSRYDGKLLFGRGVDRITISFDLSFIATYKPSVEEDPDILKTHGSEISDFIKGYILLWRRK